MQGPLRTIFSLTVLALWALFGLGLASGAWTATHWALLIAGCACCLVIFREFAWVFNYGYGLTMFAGSVIVMAMHPTPAGLLIGGLAALFGVRMMQFTHARYAHRSYLDSEGRRHRAAAAVPLPLRIFMWVFVSWLMACELMALSFVAVDGRLSTWVLSGAALMAVGLALEAVADQQKQTAKRREPEGLVTHGLYARVRHPNYSGEILFQLGIIVSCLGAISGWWQTLLALLAPLYIILLMAWSARQLDESQQARHGANLAYAAWRERTGGLLPF
jgi:steroid 5-alpha reductase family enzyme